MNGIFSRWQPRYAEHGIATVPVDPETKIARMQWQKVGLPASAKMAQQPRYAAYNGIGFACGKRNRITVLDIDSTDERLLSEALARHGDTPIVERTASGKFHAFYRHNEESRSCRQATGLSRYQKLWGADVPIDLPHGLWSEWRGPRDNETPRKLSQGALARMLSPFGIRPKTIWPPRRGTRDRSAKGYLRKQFETAWASYCGTPSQHSNVSYLDLVGSGPRGAAAS